MKIRTWLLALAFLPGCGDEKADTDGSSSGVGSTGDSPTGEPTGEPTSGGGEDSLPRSPAASTSRRGWPLATI